MFNYLNKNLNDLFIKKIFFLLFFNLTLSSIETKVTQYNTILNNICEVCINDKDLAKRNKMALKFIENCAVNRNYNKDNIVGISIHDDNTKKDIGYILCSSIINGKISDEASRGVIRKKREIDTQKDFIKYKHLDPISMLDLLYMDISTGDGLEEKFRVSRKNKNRKIIEKVIKSSINAWKKANKQQTLKKKHDQVVTDIYNSIEEIVITKIIKKDEKMKAVKVELSEIATAVIDFINRLREYSDVIPYPSIVYPFFNKVLIDKDTTRKILRTLLEITKNFNDETTLSNIIIYMHRMISSPWNWDSKDKYCVTFLGLQDYPVPYFSVITHTEQMIDWLSFKFNCDISVTISSKAPCLKCSNYIRNATSIQHLDAWNNRTIIGFHTGWNDTDQLQKYQYPVKVFNAFPVNTSGDYWVKTTDNPAWLRQFESLEDNKGTYSPSNQTLEKRWKNKDGLNGSSVYAIENYESYSRQLRMNSDGSVSEEEPIAGTERNLLGGIDRTTYPILLPAAQNSTTGPDTQRDSHSIPIPPVSLTPQGIFNTQQNSTTGPDTQRNVRPIPIPSVGFTPQGIFNTQPNPALAIIPPQVRLSIDKKKRKANDETDNHQTEASSSKKKKLNPPDEESKPDNLDDQ